MSCPGKDGKEVFVSLVGRSRQCVVSALVAEDSALRPGNERCCGDNFVSVRISFWCSWVRTSWLRK